MPANSKIITLSVVTYNVSAEDIGKVIRSVSMVSLPWKLYIVDNSPSDELKKLIDDPRIEYIHNPSNPGFGASHNLAIDLAIAHGSKYHFIVNPDIWFETDVVSPMVKYMAAHPDTGMMMPEILYPDGSIQYLPKLLPSPFWILKRKMKSDKAAYRKFIENYELRNKDRKESYNAPIISGCFSLLNLDVIREVGGYDDGYFMYFEDFDLSRRIHRKYKTIYYPEVSVYHGYEGGANKSMKLFKVFVRSAIRYFNKWGWLFDAERKRINRAALNTKK